MARRYLLLLAVICCLGACNYPLDSNIMCTDSIEPAIEVRVRDAESGLPTAEGATGYVQDGSYVDSLRAYGFNGQGVQLSFRAANERPGVYTVVVIKSGYQTWKKDGVRVSRDECRVQTRSLTADLMPTTK